MTDTLTVRPKAPLFQAIARALVARANCTATNNVEWLRAHTARAEQLARDNLPSGSGFDSGTRLDIERSTASRLVFTTSFHHMNENGFYDGWTEHTVTVRASLAFDFELVIGGRDRNDIKDYIAECFNSALRNVVEEYPL